MTAPPRPSERRERAALRLFLLFSPRVPLRAPVEPPGALAPWEPLALLRPRGGELFAWRFPALKAPGVEAPPHAVALFLHPWMEWGGSYFFRRDRVVAVRHAGFEAWVVDLAGFGRSTPPAAFFDRDVEDALDAIALRRPGVPVVVWGVSSGGYWAHPALSRRGGIQAAFFEDVAAHLFEWSWRSAPIWRPGYALFRALFPEHYRWLDLRRHAPYLGVRAATYVSGALDRGVRPEDTRALAAAARAQARVIEQAGHLQSIKLEPRQVIDLALATFARGL